MRILTILLITLTTLFSTVCFAERPPEKSTSPSLAPMLKKVMPSIVSISGTQRIKAFAAPMIPGQQNPHPQGNPQQLQEHVSTMIGSGVIVDKDQGYVLTNAHVVADLQEIEVTLADNRKFQAKLIGHDQASDLALLKIEADNLQQATLADSDQVEVGDFVVAIGNPYGLSHTATFGIVSGISRNDIGMDGYYDFIQTNADINMGNSGGGLINMQGEVVGINTMIFSNNNGSIGLGFAIPSNMAQGIVSQLAAHGHVDRGPLGVRAQPLTPTLAKAFKVDAKQGAVVYEVVPGTPAAIADMQAGDVILSIGGKQVKDSFHLRTLISLIPPGSSKEVIISRNGIKRTLSILMTNPRDSLTKGEDIFSGLKGGYFVETEAQEPIKGIRILEIKPESPLALAELLPGDIIVAVDAESKATPDISTLKKLLKSNQDVLLLRVVRDQFAFFVGINQAKENAS